MNIIGENIILRAIELSDKEILKEIINDGETEYLIGGWSFPVSDLEQEEWIRSLTPSEHIFRCMIVDKHDNTTVGTTSLAEIDYKNGKAELHGKLAKDIRHKGYGIDMTRTMVKYAFDELRLHCVFGQILSHNTASIKMVESCGWQKEGTLRGRVYKKGRYHDVYVYSILNEDRYGDRR